MNKYFGNTALAAGLLTILTVSVAHAQVASYDPNGNASQLGSSASQTAPYTSGDSQLYVPSSYTDALGSNAATFTATQGDKFESFTNYIQSGTSVLELDFAAGTKLLDTFDAEAKNPTTPNGSPTGPLRIDFASGVSSFGLNVQGGVSDFETFSLTLYNGTTVLNPGQAPFVFGPFDNTGTAFSSPPSSGKSVFVGAYTTGDLSITSALISSTSFAPDPNPAQGGKLVDTHYGNDFFFGPLSANDAPVPEASTTVSFGLLLMLGVGGAALSARRNAAKKASAA